MKIKEVTISIDVKTAEILTIAMDKLSDEVYHSEECDDLKELKECKKDIDKIWRKINDIYIIF